MAFSKVVKVVGLALFAPLARGMLTPDNGLKALDAVEGALQKMLTGAKTDQVLLKLARPVVEKIEATVHLVETGNLTKKENQLKCSVPSRHCKDYNPTGRWPATLPKSYRP